MEDLEAIRKEVLNRIDAGIAPNNETVRAIDMAATLAAKKVFDEMAKATKPAYCDCPAAGELGCICGLHDVIAAMDKLRIKWGV